ncbi:uncharacterized protein LOC116013079 [Ipomoea triloba]|uniref:uncharacterized protein LOC116013079 n=1 Tax=Ipomoea triloba TaxID=35885 RepID=UPI00125DBBB9|nr:uncharacterized protein LOC116013079 [Ipomoea triloba]
MHLRQNGIDTGYTRWIFHGEPPIFQESVTNDFQNEDDDLSEEHIDGVQEFLNDYENFVDFNSHLNPNIESCEVDDFENMMREAKQELYPGCTKFSKLSLIVKLLHLKVYNKWSNKSFDMLLELLSECLPIGNTLPRSHYESKAMLRSLGLGYINIHACKYDCVLFWKELEKHEFCPICGTSRWKVKDGKGKNIPHKILRYFPLKPRLQRFFMSKKTAKDMRWHKERRIDDGEYLRHPADSKAWKDFDQEFPWFANDARNVRLGLASDGFNPFGNMDNSYSMWPVILIPYNLPPWMYLMELWERGVTTYEDLMELWERGVTTYDACSLTNFQAYGNLSGWTINDFPAYGNLSGWRSKKFNGKVESRSAPLELSGEEVLRQLHEISDSPFGKHPNKRKRKRNLEDLNWCKKSIFFKLPYWKKLKLRHNLDVMHIEKNICDNIIGTLLNIDGKNKDTLKARQDLDDMNIRKELHLVKKLNGSYEVPHPCYMLTREERLKFAEFLKSVKFLDGYASNITRCVNVDGKLMGLKSHDCHVLLQRVLPIGVRGSLEKEVTTVLSELGDFFRKLL